MEQDELIKQIEELRKKISHLLSRQAGLRQKSKYLEMQYHDAKQREQNSNELVMELLERQRELNVMLNRANIMLSRTQEAMALTSIEFNEMVKALPEPKKAEWSDRVARINELFKKTGIQDAEITAPASSPSGAGFNTDELKKESEQAFGRKHPMWDHADKPDQHSADAELVTKEPDCEHRPEPDCANDTDQDHTVLFPQRKPWWRKLAG